MVAQRTVGLGAWVKAAGHILSTVRKQRDTCVGAPESFLHPFPILFSVGDGPPYTHGGLLLLS